MMDVWIAKPNGYFFPRSAKISSAISAKLQMLTADGVAENRVAGVFIPFEKAVLLSDEDAELLKFPPRNPYRISIRTSGVLGKQDFRYILEIMRPTGEPFISPKIVGALLHLDSETVYRLNADQYELCKLAANGNENISKLNGRQIMISSLENVYLIQKHAALTDAKLDKYISVENMKVVVPDGLDISFEETRDGNFQIQPVLLIKDNGGNFHKLATTDFQESFSRRRDVSDVYVGRNRERYICNEAVKRGLVQIKAVPKLTRADKDRYSRQPKELFTDDVFHFSDENFSDRVIGIEEISGGAYFNDTAYKIDWFDADTENNQPNNFSEVTTTPVNANKTFAIKIKPNLDRIDYSRDKLQRVDSVFANALLPHVKLLRHQNIGVNKIFSVWKSGYTGILLADDMGLGKTLQTLAFIAGLKKCCGDYSKINKPVLIIAPTALLTNWRSEYEKFIRKDIFQTVTELHGQNLRNYMTGELTPNNKRKLQLTLPKDTLALTTYETLRDYQFSFAEVDWCCIIVDEVQKIKNPFSGITTALKAMKYDYSVSLSGTPVENSWMDLWSIMDFVQPAHLGDLNNFKAVYLQPLKKDSSVENIEKLGQKLKLALGDLFLRRMKEGNLSELPPKYIYQCREEMSPYQKQCYLSALSALKHGGEPLKILADLRNISLHPDLISMSLENFFAMDVDAVIARSARLTKTFAILTEIYNRREKVLIFVLSRKMQLILVHLLKMKFNIEILPPINGTMDGNIRQRTIDEFNKIDGFNVLVLSPEAAGVGLNITTANNVIHLSRTWNPAKEEQATSRVYRIGQKKSVNVYLPMACHKDFGGGSFDEKLDTLLNYKRRLSETVLYPGGDNANEILTMLNDLELPSDADISHWTIAQVDGVTGDAFERIITDLYNSVEGYAAEKTPHSNDNGADVVVISKSTRTGFLIQCKHKDNPVKNLGKDGIQQIKTAVAAYSKKYPEINFQPMVITNAENFTAGAVDLANVNHVRLMTRQELSEMLRMHRVTKF